MQREFASTGTASADADEVRIRPRNLTLLKNLALATGGALDATAAEILKPTGALITVHRSAEPSPATACDRAVPRRSIRATALSRRLIDDQLVRMRKSMTRRSPRLGLLSVAVAALAIFAVGSFRIRAGHLARYRRIFKSEAGLHRDGPQRRQPEQIDAGVVHHHARPRVAHRDRSQLVEGETNPARESSDDLDWLRRRSCVYRQSGNHQSNPAVEQRIITDYPEKYLMARMGFAKPTQEKFDKGTNHRDQNHAGARPARVSPRNRGPRRRASNRPPPPHRRRIESGLLRAGRARCEGDGYVV